METTDTNEKPCPNPLSRQHLGVRMGPGFRSAIKQLHDEQKMRYPRIAALLGFADQSGLFNLLAGRRGVSHAKAAYIAGVLGKPLEELREETQ